METSRTGCRRRVDQNDRIKTAGSKRADQDDRIKTTGSKRADLKKEQIKRPVFADLPER
jgi:hypothetical protein